jgi:ribokinase
MSDATSPRLVVVGSLNLDRVSEVFALPEPGETVPAVRSSISLGGKGANQAVCAARHGVAVAMVGCVGGDRDGAELVGSLTGEGVDTTGVRVGARWHTGAAQVTVAADGANSIVVTAGANGELTPEHVRHALSAVGPGDVVLIQLEIPIGAALAAAEAGTAAGARVILNPAPAQPLPAELAGAVDVLVPNLNELVALTGGGAGDPLAEAPARARALAGDRSVVVTLGEHGALVVDRGEQTRVPAPRVEAIDTTAAGDAFCGSLASEVIHGSSLLDAVRVAVRVGALATTRRGALSGLPVRSEIADARYARILSNHT